MGGGSNSGGGGGYNRDRDDDRWILLIICVVIMRSRRRQYFVSLWIKQLLHIASSQGFVFNLYNNFVTFFFPLSPCHPTRFLWSTILKLGVVVIDLRAESAEILEVVAAAAVEAL